MFKHSASKFVIYLTGLDIGIGLVLLAKKYSEMTIYKYILLFILIRII